MPKIVWTAVNSEYRFCYVPQGVMLNNALFMITGEMIYTLLAIFNSSLLKYYLLLTTGESYQYGSKETFNEIPIFKPSQDVEVKFQSIINDIISGSTKGNESIIDNLIYEIYNLTEQEIKQINKQLTK